MKMKMGRWYRFAVKTIKSGAGSCYNSGNGSCFDQLYSIRGGIFMV